MKSIWKIFEGKGRSSRIIMVLSAAVLLLFLVVIYQDFAGNPEDQTRGRRMEMMDRIIAQKEKENSQLLEQSKRSQQQLESMKAEIETAKDKEAELVSKVAELEADNLRLRKMTVYNSLEKIFPQTQSSTTPAIQTTNVVLEVENRKREVYCKNPAIRLGRRPIFLFIVGAEGTGHHLIANFLKTLPNVKILPRAFQKHFAEIWEPVIGEKRRAEKKRILMEDLRKEADEAALNLLKSDNLDPSSPRIYLIQSEDFDMYSFPYDEPRNPLRRPDLLDLIQIVEPFFDLRILVTLRNQLDSIVSLVRRKWWTKKLCKDGIPVPNQRPILYTKWPLGECGYIHVQARVIEDSLIYMNSQLQAISREYYRTIKYEELMANTKDFVQPLARFLEFQEGQVASLVDHIKPKGKDYTKSLTQEEKDAIKFIFGGNRAQQWGFITEEEHSLLRYSPEISKPGFWSAIETCWIQKFT